MSVYKSRRKDAAADFISLARELRKTTIRIIKKFPASYRWTVTNNMLTLAAEVYTFSIKGNAIYVHKDMSQQDFELRRRYLLMAASSADALLGEITFCYELVDEGNNFYDSKADYDKDFQTWTTVGNATLSKLRGIIESDKSRWASYCKKREAKRP